jgi:pimeloyl-ACP methyl ester carboxylesterase
MAHFVLVHGAWHGAWCWHKVAPRLAAAGHLVTALDLPGLGTDRTPTAAVTLDLYAQRIAEALDRRPEPAILVGHSMGGMAISQAAERGPERIACLAYVTAFLPATSQSLADCAALDADSLVPASMIPSADHTEATVAEESIRPAFYGRCEDEDVWLARSLLVPQTLAPIITPAAVTEARFGRIPKAYVECALDRAITLPAQRRMQGNWPLKTVSTIETDHSPFFSAAPQLVEALLSLAG